MPADYAAKANEYARAVVAGEIIACRWIKLACQRHLDDLTKVSDPDYPYKFSSKKAAKICRFAEMLPLGGRWGGKGITLTLQPWQCFILACTFGWLHKKDNLRRFRTVYLYVPRKNGKSFLSAVVGLYMLLLDGEQQAEIYTGVTTEEQAQYVFRPAQQIVRKTPGLKAMGVQCLANAIVIPVTESRMATTIGQPPDGSSPSCALLDESHEWSNDHLMSTMQTGMGARLQPLTWVTTTAGYNTAGPAKLMQDDLQDVLEGIKQDDELFGLIYGLDVGDDWKDELAIHKANPNLGISVGLDYLKSQQLKAIQSPRLQTQVKTKHFNIWCASAVGWMDMDRWQRCSDTSLNIEDFAGETCWAGLDLASKLDLTAYILIFMRVIEGKQHFYLFPRFYLPSARIDDPANGHYKQWSELGYLEATPGEVNTHAELREQISADAKQFDMREVGHDPHGASQLVASLMEEGLTCIELQQTWKYQSEPMKTLEALVMDGRLHHDGNPVMTWNIANTIVHHLRNEVITPDKASAEKKIDGTVATIMALGRATITAPAEAWFEPFVLR
ncbi:terminase TerL endonuclease subunit [Granulicella sp. dw_53]|uniref:terminase large subunit n=1 Tax=Granulicella sp. dw_53 TaxID=2719792 RepID=UPI001BD6BD68|nr:terminase TerL endonuclease subunit [Granulicella sp. dw_53]